MEGGALFSHPFRPQSARFIPGEPRFQTSRKETESQVSVLKEPVTCLRVCSSSRRSHPCRRGSDSHCKLNPALPCPLPCTPPLRASSFPPLPVWAQRETHTEMKNQRLILLAEQSSCCADVGLSQTTN